jgi:sensor histidine kinase YesM
MWARARLAAEQARAEAALRAAAENQLKLLESQLEPHMLFNTLANLRVLIALDANRAQAMLDHLIAFLRSTLHASRAGLHPLADEFARLADYLALMAVRMGPRLETAFDLPDDLRALPVPTLLLQPLVENSIKHGLEPKVEGGRIELRARREGDTLVLSVRDSGVGLNASAGTSGGSRFGLEQVRQRLATLYGSRAQLALESPAEGGTEVRLTLPCPTP